MSKKHKEMNKILLSATNEAIHKKGSRDHSSAILNQFDLYQRPNATLLNAEEGVRLAQIFRYPLIIRPSTVLGRKAIKIVYNASELINCLKNSTFAFEYSFPLLLECFIADAIKVSVLL